MNLVDGRLIGGLDDDLVDVDVRRSRSHPDERFRDVLCYERFHAPINLPSPDGIPAKADVGKFGEGHAWIE